MTVPYVPHEGPVVTRAEAKDAGLKRYFTGKPCSKGHLSERKVSDHQCVACHRVTNCAFANAKYASDPEAGRESKYAYRRANPERHAECDRLWRIANAEWLREYKQTVYYADVIGHRERAVAYRRANPERVRASRKAYTAANSEKVRITNRLNKARRRGAEGRFTKTDIQRIFKQQKSRCAYYRHCKQSIANGYHIDHIVAVANGGTNHPHNIQLTCGPCNQAKSALDPIDFAQRLGLLI